MESLVKAVVRKLDKWNVDTFLQLISSAVYGFYPTTELIAELRRVTGLLPPQELTPLTWKRLQALAPHTSDRSTWSEERELALRSLQNEANPRMDDEIMHVIWPYRAKMDLAIRRTRFRDIYNTYKLGNQLTRMWYICWLLPGFDIISVCNVLNAEWVMSTSDWSWFDFWHALGAFKHDLPHYNSVAKFVNDSVKKYPTSGFPRFKVIECGVISGYRNPPYPGFDVIRDTKLLADGGDEHGLNRSTSLAMFTALAESTLNTQGEAVEWKGFTQYVIDGDWETSGSSSVGVVTWQYGDEKGHFKARKNMVPDVVNLDELAKEALNQRDQVNKSIIKSELGKLRLAVSSDMYTYLKMSWITRLMGGSYKLWPGSTIEEDVEQQTNRMILMLETIHNRWNLPFDYAAFDHQPTTDELIAIIRVMVKSARRNVPVDHRPEFEDIVKNVIEGFHHATLSAVDDLGKTHTFPVTGGVMSGLRWTTILGNAWNTVMTGWVLKILGELGVEVDTVKRWIRGDDSAIVTLTYQQALLFRLGYQALGAVGSDGKFGIHIGQTEFLRTWYDRQGCHGYAIRSVPGMLQRKPWSSAPWDDEAVMGHLYETARTLRRRGCDEKRVDTWWRAVATGWSKRNHVSTNWLQIPRQLGGLGICPWDGKTFPRDSWPRTDTLALRVTNLTEWRALRTQEKYQTFCPISIDTAKVLAENAMAKKVASDDVPQINSIYRKNSVKPKASNMYRQELIWSVPAFLRLQEQGKVLRALRARRDVIKNFNASYDKASFGEFWYVKQKWADMSDLYRVEKRRGLMKWFSLRFPDFYRAVRKLERRGLTRWEALDWVFGDTTLNIPRTLHPALVSVLHKAVIEVAQGFLTNTILRPRQLTQAVAKATTVLEASLLQSELSRVVYQW